ncbi:MAG: hypothetical protein ABL966_04260 [Acidimicrobiales bacterium]
MRRWAAAVIAIGATVAYARARHWFLGWGAAPQELDGALPGDDLLPHASMVTTRAITVDAPPDAVWPWLVQLGQDRGGFYSYDWLENLFGLGIHTAERVVPEWQTLAVGDQIRVAPERAGPEAGFTVVALEPRRSIVTVIGDPAIVGPRAASGALPEGGTWALVLRPIGTEQTRLLVRLRTRLSFPWPAAWFVERLIEPVHFVMERKQLLTIRSLAGRYPAPADAPSVVSPLSASTG